MKKLVFLFIFLLTAMAMAQTTVTLEDQCNCEVLSGTAVTAAGMTTPTGADLGDIYVNTNTGTIYFWDGGAWGLTSTDSQQLQAFSFDAATNMLTLQIENGGSITVDLSALSNSGSDDQLLSLTSGNILNLEDGGTVDLTPYLDNSDDQNLTLAGNTLTLEDGGTVDLGPYLDNTDDQTVTAFSIDNATNVLTITLENGNTQTVDLSALDNAGTDDQNLTLSGNILTLEDGGTVDLGPYLDNTDDQAITDFSLDGATNVLTLTLEDGGTRTVDLSGFVSSDDQNLTLAGNTLTLEDGGTVDLGPYLDNTDDQTVTAFSIDNATNVLTITLENGNTQTVDLSGLDNAGSDDQNVSGSGLSGTDLTIGIENGTNETVDLSSLVGTDDQNIENLGLAGNILTVGIEDGSAQTVDLSALDNSGTDDQNLTLSGNILTLEDGGTVDLGPYLDDTDDQAITDFSLDGATNVLTLTLEDGGTQTADLSGFVSSDDQDISGSGLTGNILTIGIENGTNETVDLSPLDNSGTDDQNLTLAGNTLTLEDGGTVDLGPYLDNTDDQTVTAFSIDNATNVLTITLENGNTQTVDLSALDNSGTDDQNLTLAGNTLTLEDGGTVDLGPYLDNTDDQTVTAFSIDNATNVLTITLENGNTQTVDLSGLDNAGTDDQNIENLGLAGNILTIGIEDGSAQTVDLSTLDNAGTDDQNLTLSGNILTLEDGGTVDLGPYLDNTDDQTVTAFSIDNATNVLTITLENGNTQTVDLSALDNSGTDDQNLTLAGNTLTLEDGGTVDLGPYLDNTDDQTVTAFSIDNATNVLTITLENGNTQTVDLSGLDNAGTDDQNIENLGLAGNILTVGIEDGSAQTVDLSTLDNAGTDDQNLTLSGNILTLEDGGTVDLGPYLDDTDDQAITDFSLDGATNVLTLTLEDGGTRTVDLSGFVSSDDQNLTLAGNTLTLEDGGTVDLGPYLDNTDDQAITDFSLDGATNVLTLTLEDGGTQTADLTGFVSSDDQNLTLAGNTLTLEDGGTVDLGPYLDDTDDQTVTAFSIDNATNVLAITLENGNTQTVDLSALDNSGTDDQNLTLAGNTLTLEDGGTVDLGPYLDNTDDQTVTAFSIDNATNVLTITLENGNTQTVDLSGLDNSGTDDQDLGIGTGGTSNESVEVTITDGSSATVDIRDSDSDPTNELTRRGSGGPTGTVPEGTTYVDTASGQLYVYDSGSWSPVGGSATSGDASDANELITSFGVNGTDLRIVEAGNTFDVPLNILGTDDQGLILSGTDLAIEDGNTVDLSGFVSSDDQNIENLGLAGNILTVGIEDGSAQTVDLSALDNAGTDDQNIENLGLAGNILTVGIEDGSAQTVDLSALDNAGTDDQNLTLSGNILTLEDGGTVDLGPYLDDTDDQAITDFSLDGATNVLTLTLEDGGTRTVDLSGFVSSDDQDISGSGLTGNILTIGIENGTNETVDLSPLDNSGTDDQNLTLAGNTLTLEDGGTVDLGPYLDNTDDQAITDFSLDGATNVLTLTLEDGGTQTADLSGFVSSDDQDISGSGLTGNILTIGIENGTNETVDLSPLDNSGTDDQNLTLAGNTLTLEDGGTVDLGPYLDNTDDQNISGSGLSGTDLTIGIENGTNETVDLSSLVGTDDQNIENLGLAGNILTVGIENGSAQTVDLSALDNAGSDDQNISGSGLSGTDLTIGIENGTNETVDLSSLVGTDDQNIENLGLAGNILTVGIENGSAQTVDLSALDNAGTDDQNLTLAGNTLTLEDGGTVDLGPYLDNTDDQTVTAFSIDNVTNVLTITLENGNTQTVDLSALDNAGSDDQNISGSGLSGTDLTIGIENGTNETVDLSSLVGTDDQNIENLGLAGNILTVGIENGSAQTVDLSALDNAGTDDQNLTLAGNTLTLEDGGTVDLGPYLDNTDDQTVTAFSIDNVTNVLTITLENGNTQTVDLSALDNAGSDDQNISGSGLSGTDLTIGIENGTNQTVDLSSLVGTDDQNLTLSGNILTLEDGGTVDLGPYLDNTDDQDLGIGTGGTSNESVEVTITDGSSATVDIRDSDSDPTNELTRRGSGGPTGTAPEGTTYVDTASGQLYVYDSGSWSPVGGSATPGDASDANELITSFGVNGTDLRIVEAGNTFDVPLNILGTDDQGLILSGTDLAIEDGNTVDLSGFVSSDDQNIENLGLAGNILTVGIEDGAAQTVDLSALNNSGTDDQNLTLAGNTLTLEDGGTVDLGPYLDNTDDQTVTAFSIDNATNVLTITLENGNTQTVDLSGLDNAGSDDQNVSGSGLSGTDLTIGIENGTNETVDLSSLVGTDDQNLTGATLNGSNILQIDIEDGTSTTVDLSALDNAGTDDQNLTLAGNTLTLEDGGTVDLGPYLDNTDDQTVTAFSIDNATNVLTITLENGNTQTVDLSGLDNAGTDDQNIENLGLAGNILTVGIEDGSAQTVDLSTLDNAGTDDQNLTLSGNILTLEDGGTVDLGPYLDDTDDQAITDFSLDGATNVLTLTLEDGGTRTVDLSGFVSSDDQNLTLAGNTLTLEDGGTVDLGPYLDNTDDQQLSLATDTLTLEDGGNVDLSGYLDNTDDQNIENLGLAGNILTVGIEDGAAQTVDLSALDNSGTDDQNLTLSGNILTLEDGGTVDLGPYLDDTDDQAITDFSLDGATNVLTLTLEDGGTQTADLTGFVSSDDQNLTLAGNTLTLEDGGTVDLGPYLDNTDDQNISGSGLSGTDLTIGIENGTNETVDLSSLVGTDDQNIENLGLAGNILTVGIEDGSAQTVDLSALDNAGTDDQNLTLSGNILTLEDGGTVDLGPYLDDTDDQAITDFSLDGATNVLTLTLEDGGTRTADLSGFVSSDDQDISGSGLTGNILTIGIENGTNETVDLSPLDNSGTDDQNLTLAGNTLTLEDGGTVDLGPYLDNTDDQNISGSGLSGTDLTIGIENGTNETVDLSSLVGTDDQNIENLGLAGNILTVGIEDGSAQTVDLSALDNAGTDDQNLTLAGNTLTLEDGGTVDLGPYLDNTDDQTVTAFSIDNVTNVLTITLENGNTQTVDLSALDNAGSDDQNISGSGLSGTDLTIGIENGTNQTVDLSSLVGTDDQNLTLSGNILTLEDGGTVDLGPYLDNTDDQTVTAFSIDNATNVLTITLENGNTQTVDLSSLDDAGTDDQQLSLATNTLTLEDGGNVDLSGYLDNTDDQNIENLGLAGNILTVGIENGTNETVDLSSLVGTDDQNLTGATLNGSNILQIDIEDGTSTTVDLSALDNAGTDDQNLTLSGNILTLEDGGTVDLGPYLDNTDDQNISGSGLSGTDLTIGIENGTNQTVDLSSLVGTDDQNLTLSGNILTLEDGGTVDLGPYLDNTDDQTVTAFSIDNATNVLAITLENGNTQTVDLSSLDDAGTDDQQLSLATNTLTLEDGGNVDLSGYLDNTDDQNIENLGLAGNILTVGIEDGSAQTVDLSALDNAGTDDQNLTLSGNILTLEDGGTVDLGPYLDDTDDQAITDFSLDGATNVLTLTLEDGGTQTADLSGFVSSDDQDISGSGLTGNILTIGIENGTNETVDLSPLDNSGTDDQNLTGATLNGSNILQIDIEDGTSTTVDLSALDNAGTDDQNLTLAGNTLTLEDGGDVDLSGYLDNTDDQNIENLGLAGNVLTVGIKNGTAQTVDLSALNDSGTDDQQLSLVTNTLALEDGGNVDLSGYLDNTDDQDIENLNLSGNTLTVGIENGTAQTVDLSALDDNGTDDQNLTSAILNGSNVLQIDIENGNSTTVDLSSLDDNGTDDQTASEVNSDTPTDLDGDGANEATVEDVIQAIAPITSKAARIFYPPSIAVDASSSGTGRTLNLYTEYTNQYATPAVASTGAPAAIPTYAAGDLYYYVTYYDTGVFANISVDANGVMTYDVTNPPADYNSLINVVFVVK
ncbi:hypothetical protein RQM65_03910 [Pricia sp. S334]|uniref:Uncharacterized protein n=1 Tax=Pricia mediterranea TaxID=3076079 RepID=A0ABU3L250_9FLAO|nr:hypothetical protein [Pricia sp. S334]MDT7827810.1 hypothetical protein [Pricia sp. S334]